MFVSLQNFSKIFSEGPVVGFFELNNTKCDIFVIFSRFLENLLEMLRSESPSGMCTKLHTVAASNNRHHIPWSLSYCLFAPHIYGCCSSRTSRSCWITHSTQRQRRGCNREWKFRLYWYGLNENRAGCPPIKIQLSRSIMHFCSEAKEGNATVVSAFTSVSLLCMDMITGVF